MITVEHNTNFKHSFSFDGDIKEQKGYKEVEEKEWERSGFYDSDELHDYIDTYNLLLYKITYITCPVCLEDVKIRKEYVKHIYSIFCMKKNMKEENLKHFLEKEGVKIKKADELKKKLDAIKFGLFNPYYWKNYKEYYNVVQSFKMVDENYNVKLPKPNQGETVTKC